MIEVGTGAIRSDVVGIDEGAVEPVRGIVDGVAVGVGHAEGQVADSAVAPKPAAHGRWNWPCLPKRLMLPNPGNAVRDGSGSLPQATPRLSVGRDLGAVGRQCRWQVHPLRADNVDRSRPR